VLNDVFTKLATHYTASNQLIDELWTEIDVAYSGKKRHYHTLAHLESLYTQLVDVRHKIKDWNTVLFTLFYHDIIYNPLKKDNEEQSAERAEMRLTSLAVPHDCVERCKAQILATKQHLKSLDEDTNYFTDADLSILGQPWETYITYFKNVRKEYSIYPRILYNPGRKKALSHFLNMDRIFKTNFFYDKFELQAKQNLQRELETL
jgi:predicted metal-dependent HD superfamily phosphohydrolase